MTAVVPMGAEVVAYATPQRPPPRVIVAIADELLLRTVSWFLAEHGHEPLEAPDPASLFEHLGRGAPDLLLLDITAPEMPGVQMLERIKTEGALRQMPVLVISCMPPEEETVHLLSLGSADFIGKPFRVRELLARIQVQLRMRQMLTEARAELKSAELELLRARTEAESRGKLVDILHEVAGDLSPDEIYHILVRRVARALDISHCSLILARQGDSYGLVATAYENPSLRNLEIDLARYPEIRSALERGEPVLIGDIAQSPLFTAVRGEWAAAGIAVGIRSVIALPFTLDHRQSGVFFLRTTPEEPPLTAADAEFADTVIKAAVAAVRRAQALETTKADKARLEELAATDALTQTFNRRALMDRLGAELDRARRYNLMLSLLMIDLDHFKHINDTYGHLAGDDALREVSRVVKREARTVDVVGRYGGEEFVVMLPETGEEGAVAFAERVRQRVAEATTGRADGRGCPPLTVSIGVAAFPSTDLASTDDLIARADTALYRAKAEGRNRVCVSG